jgi:hypothetical protein
LNRLPHSKSNRNYQKTYNKHNFRETRHTPSRPAKTIIMMINKNVLSKLMAYCKHSTMPETFFLVSHPEQTFLLEGKQS